MTQSRFRNWCFTLFTDEEPYPTPCIDSLKFVVCQPEICPTTGKRHVQGYACFRAPVSMATAKSRLYPSRPELHLEWARGSAKENIEYCTKEASREPGAEPYTFGDAPIRQGDRTDIKSLREAILENPSSSALDLWNEGIVRNYNMFKLAERVIELKANESNHRDPPEVRWYHGPPGSGKTRAALDEFPDAWISSGSLRWFQGYTGQSTAIIDDHRPSHCEFGFLLRLLDRYPVTVELKGSSRRWTPKVIIVTAPSDPSTLYHYKTAENLAQLERRIHEIRRYPILSPAQEVPSINRTWDLNVTPPSWP